jgi:hypothetical protein
MKKRSEDMKKKCAGRNKKIICESKNVHIGDVHSSDTTGLRVRNFPRKYFPWMQ